MFNLLKDFKKFTDDYFKDKEQKEGNNMYYDEFVLDEMKKGYINCKTILTNSYRRCRKFRLKQDSYGLIKYEMEYYSKAVLNLVNNHNRYLVFKEFFKANNIDYVKHDLEDKILDFILYIESDRFYIGE